LIKLQIDFLLALCSLYSIVDFQTRINNHSSTAIDNIFIDIYKNSICNAKKIPTFWPERKLRSSELMSYM